MKINLSSIALICISTLLFNASLNAQNKGFSGGSGHFYTGVTSFNFTPVNEFLNTKQLPSFGNTCLTLGGGGFGIFNNFMLGGEGGVVSASSVANSTGEASLTASYECLM
ncbi:MAG: hypothetical protein ACK4GL_09015 [Flavobacteriales bacterium]